MLQKQYVTNTKNDVRKKSHEVYFVSQSRFSNEIEMQMLIHKNSYNQYYTNMLMNKLKVFVTSSAITYSDVFHLSHSLQDFIVIFREHKLSLSAVAKGSVYADPHDFLYNILIDEPEPYSIMSQPRMNILIIPKKTVSMPLIKSLVHDEMFNNINEIPNTIISHW